MAKTDEPLPPMWMAWLLGAIGLVLAVTLVWAVHGVSAAGSPVCNPDFPVRRSDLPSFWFVFVAIGAFVVGSLTGQVGIRQSGRSQKELGEGRWKNRRAVVAVNLGVAAFLFLVTALLLVEAWTLGHGVWPITYYVRCANDAGPIISLIGVASYSFVIGHWMWVFKEGA